jgi:hypothetical protein
MGQFRTVRYDGEENLASRSGAGQAVPRPRSGRVRGSADVAANPRNALEVYQFIQDFSNAGGNFGQSSKGNFNQLACIRSHLRLHTSTTPEIIAPQ